MLPRLPRLIACFIMILAACAERSRPSPSEPTDAQLSVELLEPAHGATVVAGRETEIRVLGRDREGENRLSGLGYMARASGITLDSVVIRFAARADSSHTFRFEVPTELAANSRLDLFGIALGPADSRATDMHSVVVTQ